MGCILAGLAGCANLQPVLAPNEIVDTQSGYVAGQFVREQGAGFAFVLRSEDGREVTMSLGEQDSVKEGSATQTVAIKVAPGRYALTSWLTYATLTKEVTSRQRTVHPILSRPFDVKAGEVVHIGRFKLSHSTQLSYPRLLNQWQIAPQPIHSDEARRTFVERYTNLVKLPLECPLCSDGVRARVLADLLNLLKTKPPAAAPTPASGAMPGSAQQ
jgi:hypothetical protein